MSTNWHSSPLDALDAAWAALTRDPCPLSLDLSRVDPKLGLPPGTVALPAVRDWILDHPRAHDAHNLVWAAVIARARSGRPAWVTAAIGMALPALRRAAGTLNAGYTGDPADLEAELLTGFLEALHKDPPTESTTSPGARLYWAAWRAGHDLRGQNSEHLTVEDLEHLIGPRTPQVPYGHPDLLVARGAALGLCTMEEAMAWIEVRLGWMDPAPIAAALKLTPDALRMRLRRLDRRLISALADGLLSDPVSARAGAELRRGAAHRASTRTGLRRAA